MAADRHRKRMISVRLAPEVCDRLDQLAAAAGQSRTEWITRSLSRSVLTGSGRPQGGDEPGDEPHAVTGT